MRYALAGLVVLRILGGCSLIYNESNIPTPEPDAAEPDAEIIVDADPSMMKISGVSPAVITEGQGDTSRKALLVIDGEHLVKGALFVMITPSAPVGKMPLLMFDMAEIDVDANGRRLAVPITLPVDDRATTVGLIAGDMIPLDITVMQTVGGGPTVTSTLPAMLRVRGLNELTAEPANGFPGGLSEFSRVNIGTGMLNALANATEPVRIQATSNLTITPTIEISAVATEAGPAGGDGGEGGAGTIVGSNAGGPGMGPLGGSTSGVPGGYAGPSEIPTLSGPNRSSGGAGGIGNTLATGGDGGGGGGSIELTAGGNLSVGAITANGAAGEQTGNPGGGGSGGVILLRAGGTLTAGMLSVTGFPNAGRARFDAGGIGTVAGAAFRGPMFTTAPLITADSTPTIIFAGAADTTYQYYVSNAQTSTPAPTTTNGQGAGMFEPQLAAGMNQLCLLVAGATPTAETRNCISIAHIYNP